MMTHVWLWKENSFAIYLKLSKIESLWLLKKFECSQMPLIGTFLGIGSESTLYLIKETHLTATFTFLDKKIYILI